MDRPKDSKIILRRDIFKKERKKEVQVEILVRC